MKKKKLQIIFYDLFTEKDNMRRIIQWSIKSIQNILRIKLKGKQNLLSNKQKYVQCGI